MAHNEIETVVVEQRAYFRSGATRPLERRLQALRDLRGAIAEREDRLIAALHEDLGKAEFEAYATEVSFVYEEIDFLLKELGDLGRDERVSTPLILQPASSRILIEPLGVVLVIGPWNYPFQLLLAPLVGALAAGNCVIVKPSEMSPATSAAVRDLLEDVFPAEWVSVVEGGVEVAQRLLAQRFDHIFYTGGPQVGRVVLEAAARYLTPVTLELGGKSPCVVHRDSPFKVSARRVIWGKFLNAGQTCVAPDYLLVHESIADAFLDELVRQCEGFFGSDPRTSPDYGRIVNDRHFQRVASLLEGVDILHGGARDRETRYFGPTLIRPPNLDHPVMKEEIFGPILPIWTYRELEDVYEIVERNPQPLAFYFFSSDRRLAEEVMARVSYGGGCVNDTVVHLANPHLPFGGIGASGMGAYHGRFSFRTFSHRKGVLFRSFSLDAKFRYPPYEGNLRYLKWMRGSPF